MRRLPVPSRDEIISSPIQQNAPENGATGYYTQGNRVPSPVMDDPSADLERELELAEASIARVKTRLAHAKKTQNERTWPSQFPIELLERIFLWTKDLWPQRAIHWQSRNEDFGRYPVLGWCGYDLAWIKITFVCSSWRTVSEFPSHDREDFTADRRFA